MKLYKFKSLFGDSFLNSLDMIVNGWLFLATCDYMNDQEEGAWDVDNLPINEEYLENAQKIRDLVDSIKFTSFTSSYDIKLLWAHYAAVLAGFALSMKLLVL